MTYEGGSGRMRPVLREWQIFNHEAFLNCVGTLDIERGYA